MDEIGIPAVGGALLATATLETLKYLLRKKKYGMEFDFPPKFYDYMIPFLTLCWSIILGLITLGPAQTYTLRGLISWGLAIPLELFVYNVTLKPYKEYRKEYKAKKEAKNGFSPS